MDDWQEECRLFLCLSFEPDGIPPGEVEGGNFVPPLVRNWLLEAYLLSDPLPPFFGCVNEEGGELWPPPASRVKKKLIAFSKEYIELSFATTYGEPINPYAYHPTTKSCWWWCILNVRFNLGEGEILQSHCRFGQSAHKFGTKLNKFRAKFLEITNVVYVISKSEFSFSLSVETIPMASTLTSIMVVWDLKVTWNWKSPTLGCFYQIHWSQAMSIFVKDFGSFWHLTHKNLHKNKMHVNWHARFRIWHWLWLVKEKSTHQLMR